jgi:hypothetical protein
VSAKGRALTGLKTRREASLNKLNKRNRYPKRSTVNMSLRDGVVRLRMRVIHFGEFYEP